MTPRDDRCALSTNSEPSLHRWRDAGERGTWYESSEPASVGPDHQGVLELIDRVNAAAAARRRGRAPAPVCLGDYELERLVGSGGMGQVFAARALDSGARVALKLLRRSSGASLLRIKQEFRVLADVAHPNLVKLERLVVPREGQPFFTMELVDGVPFVDYVRGRTPRGQLPNQIRLRRTLRQLLEALEHLHQRGYVHRDLKPSNVLVTGEGRVVVLDFGLVCDADERDALDDGRVGTPAYMAPEQARWGRTDPSADLYAVGVMIHECLCAQRPFCGRPRELLLATPEDDAPEPTLTIPRAERDLLDLCRGMLARDPELRPSASDALARLDQAPRSARHSPTFVGRARELARLDGALAAVRDEGLPVALLLRGPSGQGKSALLRRWAARTEVEAGALILNGRCFERESVAYKGLDTVIDALSRHLRQLPERERASLMPSHVEPLTRLFPVLAELWPGWLEPVAEGGPSVLRELALAGLRELLHRIAAERPVVVMLDDFHWADVDSARTLQALLDDPQGPPLLLVAVERVETERVAVERVATGLVATGLVATGLAAAGLVAMDEGAPAESVEELRRLERSAHAELVELELEPLSWSEASELVLPAIGHDGRDSRIMARAKALFRDSGGNPLHLCELLRGQLRELDAELDLDELIASRLIALEPELRRALCLVALVNGPIHRAVIQATGSSSAELDALLDAELLWRPDHDAGIVEITHGRIREVLLGELDSEALPQLHLELARALAAHDADAELIAEHFEQGEQPALALEFGQRAARAAFDTLAFARAASWYERCLGWLGPDAELRPGLERRLAEAYANTGRLADAARMLRALADERELPDHSELPDDGARADSLALRSKAVEYLLESGHMREGMQEVEAVLAAVDLSLPSSDVQLLLGALSYHRRLARHLARFSPRAAASQSERLHTQATTCASLSESLAVHEPLLSLHFLCRWRELAVELGAPEMFARALGVDAVVTSALGDPQRARELLAVARGHAGGDPLTCLRLQLAGASAEAHADSWARAVDGIEALLPALVANPGLQRERRQASEVLSWARIEAGDYRDVIAGARQRVQAGVDSGELEQLREGAGLLSWALVSVGELDEAQRVFEQLRAHERAPGDRYLFADLFRDFAWVRLLLRTGRGVEALAAAEQLPDNMRRMGLWRVPSHRHTARALIALATLHAHHREPTVRRRLELRSLVRKLRRHSGHQRGNAALIEASLLRLDGELDGARARLREAERCFCESGAGANLAAARLRLAELSEGERGKQLRKLAADYFVREQIRRPEELVASLAGPAEPGSARESGSEASRPWL